MMDLKDKIRNNEGKLPWDDGYIPYTPEENLWICNLALAKLFESNPRPQSK